MKSPGHGGAQPCGITSSCRFERGMQQLQRLLHRVGCHQTSDPDVVGLTPVCEEAPKKGLFDVEQEVRFAVMKEGLTIYQHSRKDICLGSQTVLIIRTRADQAGHVSPSTADWLILCKWVIVCSFACLWQYSDM